MIFLKKYLYAKNRNGLFCVYLKFQIGGKEKFLQQKLNLLEMFFKLHVFKFQKKSDTFHYTIVLS